MINKKKNTKKKNTGGKRNLEQIVNSFKKIIDKPLKQPLEQPLQQPLYKPLYKPFYQPLQQPLQQPLYQPLKSVPFKKVPVEKCKIINIDYNTDYITEKKSLSAPKKYKLDLNMQTSIDAKRFYDIIILAIKNYNDELLKHRYLCFTLKILSTSDNFYIFHVLLFLEHYLKLNNDNYTINKNDKYIILKINNEEYVIKYKYNFFISSIDIKISRKKESDSSLSKSKSSNNNLAEENKSKQNSPNIRSRSKSRSSNKISTNSQSLQSLSSSSFRFNNNS